MGRIVVLRMIKICSFFWDLIVILIFLRSFVVGCMIMLSGFGLFGLVVLV